MKYFFFILAFLFISNAVDAKSKHVVLGAGHVTGGYHQKMKEVKNYLEREGDRYSVEIKNLSGSDAIMKGLCDNNITFAPVQSDAYVSNVKNSLCSDKNIEVTGTYGEEYMMLFVPEESNIEELHDLNKDHKVFVGPELSGSARTWNFINKIENSDEGNSSDWTNAKAVYEEYNRVGGRLASDQIDAVFMVASEDSALREKFTEKHNLKLVDIVDRHIDNYMYSKKKPLYKQVEIKNGDSFWSSNIVDTFSVKTFYVLNLDLVSDDDYLESILLEVGH